MPGPPPARRSVAGRPRPPARARGTRSGRTRARRRSRRGSAQRGRRATHAPPVPRAAGEAAAAANSRSTASTPARWRVPGRDARAVAGSGGSEPPARTQTYASTRLRSTWSSEASRSLAARPRPPAQARPLGEARPSEAEPQHVARLGHDLGVAALRGTDDRGGHGVGVDHPHGIPYRGAVFVRRPGGTQVRHVEGAHDTVRRDVQPDGGQVVAPRPAQSTAGSADVRRELAAGTRPRGRSSGRPSRSTSTAERTTQSATIAPLAKRQRPAEHEPVRDPTQPSHRGVDRADTGVDVAPPTPRPGRPRRRAPCARSPMPSGAAVHPVEVQAPEIARTTRKKSTGEVSSPP